MEENNSLIIIGYEQDYKYKHIGTGFFVNTDGLIVTAGHVFKNFIKGQISLDKYYCAFPNNRSELFKIQSVYIEYENHEKQKKNTFKDLAFVKINYNSNIFFEFETHRPKVFDKTEMYGLVNEKKERGKPGDDITFKKDEIDNKVNFEEVKPHTLRVNIIDKYLVDDNTKFRNCITVNDGMEKGASGCPIKNMENKVIGMYFGGKNNKKYILHSGYIKKKLHQYILKSRTKD